jgi:release factor glutamine methyltransferase
MDNIKYLEKYYKGDIKEAIERLNKGEPVQYIVGDVDFLGYTIKVSEDVLIPRFETELLVTKTIEYINKYFNNSVNILEIGTGSGCISIALSKQLNCNIDACDISNEALEIAKENALLNEININFIESDIFSNINNKYDVIISNPPYIAHDDEVMELVANNEPHKALYAKDNGLYFYEEILKASSKYLKDKFLIAFEIGDKQALAVSSIAKKYLKNIEVFIEKDLNERNRYVFIKKS